MKHHICCITYTKNSYDPQKEGVKSIKVIKEIDDDKYFCYWQELKPGIFVPE